MVPAVGWWRGPVRRCRRRDGPGVAARCAGCRGSRVRGSPGTGGYRPLRTELAVTFVQVGLERLQAAVRASVVGRGQQDVERSLDVAVHGSGVELQVAGDRVDGPALAVQSLDVLEALPGPVQQGGARVAEERDLFRRCRQPGFLFGVLAQACGVLVADPLQYVGEVLDQVEAVGHFDGSRCGLPDRLAVGAGPVSADDLRSGVAGQPGCQGFGCSVGQHVDDATAFDIDQQCRVSGPTTQSEVVHAQHPRCPRRNGRSLQQLQDPCPACLQLDLAAQAGGRPAAEFHRYRAQPSLQFNGGALVAGAQAVDLFYERASLAGRLVAEEPADTQPYREPDPGDGALHQRPPVVGVDSAPRPGATWAPRRPTARCRLHHQPLGAGAYSLQLDSDSRNQHILDRTHAHAGEIPQGNDPACRPLTSTFTEPRSDPS